MPPPTSFESSTGIISREDSRELIIQIEEPCSNDTQPDMSISTEDLRKSITRAPSSIPRHSTDQQILSISNLETEYGRMTPSSEPTYLCSPESKSLVTSENPTFSIIPQIPPADSSIILPHKLAAPISMITQESSAPVAISSPTYRTNHDPSSFRSNSSLGHSENKEQLKASPLFSSPTRSARVVPISSSTSYIESDKGKSKVTGRTVSGWL